MRYLLDTHTLLWVFAEPSFLPKQIRAILNDPSNERHVSAATTWEVATKHRLGKLPTAEHLLNDYDRQLEDAGFTLLPITNQHARLAGSFPAKHGDPFDRMLAAQAFLENLTLLSNDPQLDHFHIQRTW